MVAQLVEQRPFKPFVEGSIPSHPTIYYSLVRMHSLAQVLDTRLRRAVATTVVRRRLFLK